MPTPEPLLGRRALGGLALGVAAAAATANIAHAATPSAPAKPSAPPAPNADLPKKTTPAWHLARRAAIAPTAALAAEIDKRGPKQWIEDQLNPAAIDDSRVEKMIAAHYPVVTYDSGAQVRTYTSDRPWEAAPALQRAIVLRQLYGNRYLLESMTEFWSDQIYVAARGKSESYVAHYNHAVLRQHALGKFSDLLVAAIRHPAVLANLDNEVNSKKNPNENLGRELLELYTVGTAGPDSPKNYSEDDVRNSALLLTGHGLDWESLSYRYHPSDHHTGPVRIMGFTDANSDAAAGPALLERYLTYLATHPATAKRLALRLCRRFVSDEPSTCLVKRLANVYLDHGTDIKPVLRELFNSAEFAAGVGQKWRRPQEFLHAMVRACRPADIAPASDPRAKPWGSLGNHLAMFDRTGHAPRLWPYVDGYPDVASAWATTNTLRACWNTTESVLGRHDKEIVVPALVESFPVPVGTNLHEWIRTLTTTVTGWEWADADLATVAAYAHSRGKQPAPRDAVVTDAMKAALPLILRLVFASPYFQMR